MRMPLTVESKVRSGGGRILERFKMTANLITSTLLAVELMELTWSHFGVVLELANVFQGQLLDEILSVNICVLCSYPLMESCWVYLDSVIHLAIMH